MGKSKKMKPHRVPAGDAAKYRAAAAAPQPNVPGIVVTLLQLADHYGPLEASGQREAAQGAAETHHNLGVLLAATPAASSMEAMAKIEVLERFADPRDAHGTPVHQAMVVEAIAHERACWGIPEPHARPN